MDPIKIKFGTDGWRAIIAQGADAVETKKILDVGRKEMGG